MTKLNTPFFALAIAIALSQHLPAFSTNGRIITGVQANSLIQGSELIRFDDYSARPVYIRFTESARIDAFAPEILLRDILQFTEEEAIELTGSETDAAGYDHITYQYYYKGVPVDGGLVKAHMRNGILSSVNATLLNLKNVNVTPGLTEREALIRALDNIKAEKYLWEDEEDVKIFRDISGDQNLSFVPEGELIVVPGDGKINNNDHKLAYKFDIYAKDPEGRWDIYIDAHTGEIAAKYGKIFTVNEEGTAVTRYSGTVKVTADQMSNGQYRLRETIRGQGIETYNAREGTSTQNAVDFLDDDNYWDNKNADLDEAATDAHYGAEQFYDYLKEVHGRNSIDDNGFKLVGYVHWGNNWSNASYNGSYARYGDGSSGTSPFTIFDIAVHEFAHGLTGQTADLVYQNESGALNESFSDIFAVANHWFSQPDKADWRVSSLRNLQNPNQRNHPDTYGGDNWYTGDGDNGGVHVNSSVQNKWFYILSEGESATNDKGNSYNVQGIGIKKAEKIAFRNLTVYLTRYSDYEDARFYALESAKDLYGDCSNEYMQTANAWHAVGVGDKINCSLPPVPEFKADVTTTCIGEVEFSDQSYLGAKTWLWDFGDGTTSTQQNPVHTYAQNGTYTVQLTVSNNYGQNTETKTSYIQVDKLSPPVVSNAEICGSGTAILQASGNNGELRWYDALTGGNLLQTGTSYSANISNTTTFYVEEAEVKPIEKVGPADSTLGKGRFFEGDHQMLFFDVASPCIIKSVKVYADGAGERTIEIINEAGQVLHTKTVDVPDGESRIILDFEVYPGTDHAIKLNGKADLYRSNATLNYPYQINDLISITKSSAASSEKEYYYFFYDWEVQGKPCKSNRIPVIAKSEPVPEPVIEQDGKNLTITNVIMLRHISGT